ncbi:MAG: prepilin-type N-terminal cleavage/methylation domain-containing protein [Candidatus Omnitrophica bacterium]|nr:prepilin-type N-terminal cleavage/methylation domain-containing protein [Candidatus Omnitrophota bacterium]
MIIFSLRKKTKKLGFTLVELIVIVSILGLLTAVGVSSYNNFHQKRMVEKARDELKNNLRYIQGKAVNNQKPASCSAPLEGWGIKRKSNSSYVVYYNCGGPDQEQSETSISPLTLTPNFDVFFYTLGGTDLTGDIIITISDDEGNNFGVQVTRQGDIK